MLGPAVMEGLAMITVTCIMEAEMLSLNYLATCIYRNLLANHVSYIFLGFII
jgi:hypothetical protein